MLFQYRKIPKYSDTWKIAVMIFKFEQLSFIEIWAATWQNQQNGMCAQQRLRSAWASAQSDQSLRCQHEESLGP